jgi:transposase
MSKRKRYSPEYKRELVELVRRSQSSCRQIALEVGVNPNTLTRWVRESDAGGGKAFPGGGVPRDEKMARLKRELSKVSRERDFLKDAALHSAGRRNTEIKLLSR